MKRGRRERGAALVLALLLLGWTIVIVVALGASVRIHARAAEAAGARAAARSCAFAALEMAWARLESCAGPIERITGAGAFAAPPYDRWAGWEQVAAVWQADGTLLARLHSDPPPRSVPRKFIRLLASQPAGADHVAPPALPLPVAGSGQGWGAYAVFDEGTKLGVRASPGDAEGLRLRSVQSGPAAAFAPLAAIELDALYRLVTFEQMFLVAPPSLVRASRPHLALEPTWVQAGGRASGGVNVNSVSPVVWQALLEAAGVPSERAAQVAELGAPAAPTRGIGSNGPPAPFLRSEEVRVYLASLLPADGQVADETWARLAPRLHRRSDTFRLRAAGAWTDSEDPRREIIVRLEGLLERSLHPTPGRRFALRMVRWVDGDEP